MFRFSQLCESIAATSKKTEKVRLVAAYLRTLFPEKPPSPPSIFVAGSFPAAKSAFSRRLSLSLARGRRHRRKRSHELAPILRHHGDLGAGAEEILQGQQTPSPLTLTDIAAVYDSLAASEAPPQNKRCSSKPSAGSPLSKQNTSLSFAPASCASA